MKKNNLIIAIALLSLARCTNSDQPLKGGKKIHYLFIIDNPDKVIVREFESCFNKGAIALRKEQPEGIADISFTVYVPMPVIARISVDFSEDDDKRDRLDNADNFLSQLTDHEGKADGDRYILKAMNALLSEITDTGADYQILFISNMIENSGGASSQYKEDWENGNFHFTDPEQHCNPEPLAAANKQLKDSEGWIYKNLVAKTISNPLLKRQHIFYFDPGFDLRKVNGGCDGADVRNFWESLFSKMGIAYQAQGNTLKKFLAFEP